MFPFRTVLALFLALAAHAVDAVDLIVLKGAAGSSEYEKGFADVTAAWSKAAESTKAAVQVIDSSTDNSPLDTLRTTFGKAAAEPTSPAPLWLVLVGHGSSDARDSHFNLPGADLTVRSLAAMIEPVKRELVIVDTTAASGAFIQGLSGKKRVIVTATKGAEEVFFARFGEHFAKGIAGLTTADRDQDQQVSVLEAFLYASSETKAFYEKEGRIATEHALLDDNGDKTGTRAEGFSGLQAKRGTEGSTPDGLRARQIHLVPSAADGAMKPEVKALRDELENKVRALVEQKKKLAEDEYYRQLEALMMEIARLK